MQVFVVKFFFNYSFPGSFVKSVTPSFYTAIADFDAVISVFDTHRIFSRTGSL